MIHDIKLNIREIIDLKLPLEQYDLVKTIITNNISEELRKHLIAALLNDDLQYLIDEEFEHSNDEKTAIEPIKKAIEYYSK